jgi:hypothetical protein
MDNNWVRMAGETHPNHVSQTESAAEGGTWRNPFNLIVSHFAGYDDGGLKELERAGLK